MCIIIYKDGDVKLPSDKVLSTCLSTHKDGFGAMWRTDKGIFIIKGLFDLQSIKKIMSHVPVDAEAAFHFRMATHGGVSSGNCHPFPLIPRNDALTKTSGHFDTGLMHNGIINRFGYRADTLSDTMNFVKYLERTTKKKFTFDKMEHHIKGHYGKFIIFTPEYTLTFGQFFEEKKLKYSNTTYRDFNYNWGCHNKDKGYDKSETKTESKVYLVGYPIVKEIMNLTRVHFIGLGNRAEYLGCYGKVINYKGSQIFCEDGFHQGDLDLVKEDIDYTILEGEYEAGKYLDGKYLSAP